MDEIVGRVPATSQCLVQRLLGQFRRPGRVCLDFGQPSGRRGPLDRFLAPSRFGCQVGLTTAYAVEVEAIVAKFGRPVAALPTDTSGSNLFGNGLGVPVSKRWWHGEKTETIKRTARLQFRTGSISNRKRPADANVIMGLDSRGTQTHPPATKRFGAKRANQLDPMTQPACHRCNPPPTL